VKRENPKGENPIELALRDAEKAGMLRHLDDAGSMAGVAKNYTFNVTGTLLNSPTVTQDVAAFLNIPVPTLKSGQALASIVQDTESGFTLYEIAQHFATHPAPLVNWNIPFSSAAAIISTMKFFWIRKEPDGQQTQKEISVATQLTAQDFQNTRVQFSADGKLIYDGETFLQFVSSALNPVANYIVSLSFGEAFDLRSLAKTAKPVRLA
jgi:hypothetical protein